MPGPNDPNDPFSFPPLRMPVYAPAQNAAMMQDPMGMAIAMFGLPMIQQMSGPGSFLANQGPGQHLMDQFLAAQYQRSTIGANLAASRMGDADVSNKVMGLGRLLVGGGESPLRREQSDTVAQLINHPIGKMMLGQVMGPENMEALFFGRKGDPAALAAAANKIGFFRKDTLGGDRMSGQSLEDFSKSLHANLYGPEADIDAMHGFMAGQTGQLMEHMFQRGVLPQSIGALSPAERVKLISNTERDDKTVNRLAREYGHREMMKNSDYAAMTEEQQKAALDERMPTYSSRMKETFKSIDDFNERAKQPGGATSQQMEKEAKQLEETGAYGVIARNVDSKRAADKIKDYTGAVSAVRDIFGDNGNANAPMPQLLAALEHLSQGATGQMGAGKIESVLRQMRLVARDTGMGFEQMAGISAEVGAYGDTLGIARPVSVQNTLNTMLMTKAMRDAGTFDKKLFGQMDQTQATREAGMRMQRGDASGAGMTLAAMTRAVESNPEQFKNNPVMQELVKAYKEGRNTFTANGQTYDLGEMAGRGGVQGLTAFFGAQGGNTETLRAYMRDPQTQEYLKAGYTFLNAQKHQLARDVSNNILRGEAYDRVNSEEFTKKLAAQFGGTEEDANRASRAVSADFADKLGQLIVDETMSMSTNDRLDHLQKRAPEMIRQMFADAGFTGADLDKRTALFTQQLLGADAATQRDTLGRMAAKTDHFASSRTGLSLTALGQLYNSETQANMKRESAVSENKARRYAMVSRGRESSFMQRVGEELDRMGTGGEFNFAATAQRLSNIMSTAATAQAFAPELSKGIAASLEEVSKHYISTDDVNKTMEAAQKGDKAAMARLRGMAGVEADAKVVSEAELAKRLKGKKKPEEIAALYKNIVGGTSTDVDEQVRALAGSYGIRDAAQELFGEKEVTMGQLRQAAGSSVGQVKGSTPEEKAAHERAIQREAGYLEALSTADDNALRNAARELAERAIEAQEAKQGRKLSNSEKQKRRTAYETAVFADDEAAMKRLERSERPEDYNQLKAYAGARQMKKKENTTLAGEGLNLKPEDVSAAAREKEAVDQAGKAPKGAPGAAAAATPQKVETAKLDATNVALVADSVTIEAKNQPGASPGAEAVAAATKSTPAGAAAPVAASELTLTGTLQLQGIDKVVAHLAGNPLLQTPDGNPIHATG